MRRTRSGFTLIELLVVIGIIVLLAAILLPAVSKAYKVAQRARMAADLQVISQALDAYRNDFGDYPRTGKQAFPGGNPPFINVSGAATLCWALIAPGDAGHGAGNPPGTDGADGPGFRLRGTTGRVWGPYLTPGRFRLAYAQHLKTTGNGVYGVAPATQLLDYQDFLTDNYGNPIFYYPASKSVSPADGFITPPSKPGTTPGKQPSIFYFEDNDPTSSDGKPYGELPCCSAWNVKFMRWRMGDTDMNGVINGNEIPVATGPYLLWSPGPDQLFGTDDDVVCNGTALQINQAAFPR